MKKRTLWWIGMFIYLIFLFRITVFRPGTVPVELFSASQNLVPFSEYLRFAHNGSWGVFFYYFIGNILCFMPFGMILRQRDRKNRWFQALLLSILLSVLIETLQYVLGTGVTETDDVILNTFGSALGYYLVNIMKD